MEAALAAAVAASGDDGAALNDNDADTDSEAADADGEPLAHGAHALTSEHRVADLGFEVDVVRTTQHQLVDGQEDMRQQRGACFTALTALVRSDTITVRLLGHAHAAGGTARLKRAIRRSRRTGCSLSQCWRLWPTPDLLQLAEAQAYAVLWLECYRV